MRRWLHGLSLFLLIACMFLLLPIILPVAIISNARERRRLLAAVKVLPCNVCSADLGVESVRLADQEQEARMKSVRAKGFLPRIVRTCLAICVSCGARYGLDKETSTLRLLSPEGDA